MKKQDRILLLSFAGIALLMLGIFFIMEHLQGPQGICTDFGGWKQRPRNRAARCTGPADQPVGIWSRGGAGNF